MTVKQITYPEQRILRAGKIVTVKHKPVAQAVRKTPGERVDAYLAQSPGRPLTPAQTRRLRRKMPAGPR